MLTEVRTLKKFLLTILGLGLVVGLAGVSTATPVTFTGSSPSLGLAASVRFDIVNVGGNNWNLVVTLTNTSTADVMCPADILTAVFFTLPGSLVLTPSSAVLGDGSSVVFGVTDPGNVVGGEWAYKSSIPGAPGGAKFGISSAGFDLFGPEDRFPGSNLQGPDSVDGVQYGITSAGDKTGTGNQKVTGSQALIQNSVVFTLGGLSSDFDLTKISNVSFQYGTVLTEPDFPGVQVPEPYTLLFIGLTLVGLSGLSWRLKR